MKRAILTCVYNRIDHLALSIESVVCNNLFGDFDYIIVVDYNPNEEIKRGINQLKKLYSRYENISWVFRKTNLGARKNWLLSWEELAASYDFILSMEDDILLSSVSLEYCVGMESFLNANTEGLCLWRDERWSRLFEEDCHFSSFEFSAWGWYARRGYILRILEKMKSIDWLHQLKPQSRIEFLHLYKVMRYKFYWGDRLISVYNRAYDKQFIHSSVSLSKNIGLDGTGVHSGVVQIEQKELSTIIKSLSEIFISDTDLVNFKYRSDRKYSLLGSIYLRIWFMTKIKF